MNETDAPRATPGAGPPWFERRYGPDIARRGFVVVPAALLDYRADLGISAQELELLIHVLRCWHRQNANPRLNVSALARWMGLQPRRTRGLLRSLEARGCLRREARPSRSSVIDVSPLLRRLDALCRESQADNTEEREESGLPRVSGARPGESEGGKELPPSRPEIAAHPAAECRVTRQRIAANSDPQRSDPLLLSGTPAPEASKESGEPPAAPGAAEVLAILRTVPYWFARPDSEDQRLVAMLIREYPGVNLRVEAEKFRCRQDVLPSGEPRSTFIRWVEGAYRYQEERKARLAEQAKRRGEGDGDTHRARRAQTGRHRAHAPADAGRRPGAGGGDTVALRDYFERVTGQRGAAGPAEIPPGPQRPPADGVGAEPGPHR